MLCGVARKQFYLFIYLLTNTNCKRLTLKLVMINNNIILLVYSKYNQTQHINVLREKNKKKQKKTNRARCIEKSAIVNRYKES